MRYYTGYNSDNNMVEQKLQTCFLTSKVSIIPLHWCPGRVTAVLLVEVRPPATSLWVFGVLPADEGVLHTCRELPWLRQSLRDPKWGEGGEKSRVSGLPWITLTYLFTIVGDRCSGEEESHHVEAINEVTSHTAWQPLTVVVSKLQNTGSWTAPTTYVLISHWWQVTHTQQSNGIRLYTNVKVYTNVIKCHSV